MKKIVLPLAGLMAISITTLHAQSVTGIWQGTLSFPGNGRTARVAFTIQKDPGGPFHGGITFLDNNGPGGSSLSLSSVTVAPPDVTLTQTAANLTYHGKLSADGQSMDGTWVQGSQSYPLTLSLASGDAIWKPAGALPPMPANADPSYDVSIIKPAPPEEQHPIFDLRSHKFTASGTSAKELIKIAYNLRGRQVIGGPSWLEENKFDIIAEPDTPGLPSEAQTRAMVRKLLVERFHLACHDSQQDYPVMALTLDPKGPAPKPSDPTYNLHSAFARTDGADLIFQFSGSTMQQFLAQIMNFFQDKQLVDETGLTGIYDITLKLPAATFQNPATNDKGPEDERGNAMVIAAQHAGFKFVNKKVPLPVVIVDHIDPPTPN
jgi:uncharacterized protein (TIGR03435 family)